MRNLRLDICYEGTRYKGWQRLSPGDCTIQDKLETTLSRLLDEPIEVSASGRTDAGTHALHQVVNFHCESTISCDEILVGLRQYLPEDIGALSLDYAGDRFHARLCATEKTYVYRVWNSELPDVFWRRFRVQLPQKLDLAGMQAAAERMVGTHDFKAFCANKQFKKSPVRTLKSLKIETEGAEVRFVLTADGFLYHMARILVGTLLEIGMGRRELATVEEIFASRRRESAGETVPAKGLCLMEVRYQ